MRQNEKGPTSAPTLSSHGSDIPLKEMKMNDERDITETSVAPDLPRRKFLKFAVASSAATLPAVALAGADDKTSRLPQPLNLRLEKCIAELRGILGEMHPTISIMQKHYLSSQPDGSFRFSLQGDVAFQPWQGDGVYLVSIDGHPHEYLMREDRVITLSGKDMGYSHYFGRSRAEDGGWDDFERFLPEKFIRKVGEVPV